jgi:hypothetical protein
VIFGEMAAWAMGARTASVTMCSVMGWIWAVAAWTETAVGSGASFFEQPVTSRKASRKEEAGSRKLEAGRERGASERRVKDEGNARRVAERVER